jgi:hypothetical protein
VIGGPSIFLRLTAEHAQVLSDELKGPVGLRDVAAVPCLLMIFL